jgi:hypothetical protein
MKIYSRFNVILSIRSHLKENVDLKNIVKYVDLK